MAKAKPLGMKAYGSIGHVPGSRMGSGDHHVHPGQAKICCESVRDSHDRIIVQEKLDGSCTAVTKINGEVIALVRAGWPAITSPYEQHQMFANWVLLNWERFNNVLNEGERLVGEWLAQAHGTRYNLQHEPWVVFDLITGHTRLPFDDLTQRLAMTTFIQPAIVNYGPTSIEKAMQLMGAGEHGAIDPAEGVVWRVERRGVVDFLAKYVRPDKVDGCYLESVTGADAVWNWKPQEATDGE